MTTELAIEPSIRSLTDDQLKLFQRDGLVVARGMYRSLVSDLQRWASEMSAWAEVPGRHAMYFESSLTQPGARILNRIEQFIEYHPGFRDFSLGSLKAPVTKLLGEPARLFKEKINYKMPGGGGFEPHQDSQAGWGEFASYFISVMVCIDANTLDNGCAEFAAGHHKMGLLGDEWKPLTEAQLRDVRFDPCPMAPGDAVFFDSYVPHRSGPNTDSHPRRNLYVTYNRASDGDFRDEYFRKKRKNYPPDVERQPGQQYSYRV